MKAKKKPVEIDYYPFDGTMESLNKLKAWTESFGEDFLDNFIFLGQRDDNPILQVKTLEGTSYDVTTNDVVIRGVKGEYYPCKKDIFDATYDYDK